VADSGFGDAACLRWVGVEFRRQTGETSSIAVGNSLTPMLCVGETLR